MPGAFCPPALAERSATLPAASGQALAVLAALLEARTGQQIVSHRSTRVDTVWLPLMRERHFDTPDHMASAVLDGRDPSLTGGMVGVRGQALTAFP